MADAVEHARLAFDAQRWRDAYAILSAVPDAALGIDDLERLAVAARLVGEDTASVDAWTRAHRRCLAIDDPARAARCAIWLGLGLTLDGDEARGSGWLARAQHLADQVGSESSEQGLLLVPRGLEQLSSGDAAGAARSFARSLQIGRALGDADVVAFGHLGSGEAQIALGNAAAGLTSLDQAMVAVAAGEVSPIVVGIVYCAVILECQALGDVRRAQEWTAALAQWCAEQPDLVPYRGQCLVHRAEILQLHGAWGDACKVADEACDRLAGHPAQAMAHYRRGELHRVRGQLDEADEAYRHASRGGFEPQPGLSLLRLAQGRNAQAEASIRRVVRDVDGPITRARTLAAFVEIVLAGGDIDAARTAADELHVVAAEVDVPFVRALANHARGSVLIADGDPEPGCAELRRAVAAWRDVDAPYEAARSRLLIGVACHVLGDDDTAEMELDAARRQLDDLGAAPVPLTIDLRSSRRDPPPGGLTAREVEVLVLVATGSSNRAIASHLELSEHTVARHLQNIFVKLGVSSRTAASAVAFQHHLL